MLFIFVLFLVLQGMSAHELYRPTVFYMDERLMLPVRDTTNFLGISLEWNSEEGQAYVANQALPGRLLAGSLYAAASDFAEVLNAEWRWYDEFQEGIIQYGNRFIHLQPPQPPQDPNAPHVYLTFDDGPNETIPPTLEILDIFDVPAAFFLIGENVLYYPRYGRDIVERGHQIGNHSFSHPYLTRLSQRDVLRELELTQAVFREVLGVRGVLFRPPYGDYNQEVVQVARRLDLQLVLWEVNPRDYTDPGRDALVEIIVEGLRPGANILLHSKFETVQALPEIIQAVWNEGYQFAPIPVH